MKFDIDPEGDNVNKPDMTMEDLKTLNLRTVEEEKNTGSKLIKDSSFVATQNWSGQVPPFIVTDNKSIVDAKTTSYVITGESVVNTNEFKALRL